MAYAAAEHLDFGIIERKIFNIRCMPFDINIIHKLLIYMVWCNYFPR